MNIKEIVEKVKSFISIAKTSFGYGDIDKEMAETVYKKEPVVMKLNVEEVQNKEDIESKLDKPKKSWYNNGKTQKLVSTEDVESLPKTWKKGRLPKKDK